MTTIITRHRHDTRRRQLTVREVKRLTPNMVRTVLEGHELADFTSLAPDDHIKLFFPRKDGDTDMRDYTPRHFDRERGLLTIDFAVHDAGPATKWALQARVGDQLQIGGPRGSTVVASIFDWWLLIGDETALPAMGRWVEELPAGAEAITLGAVTSPMEEQEFTTMARHAAHWVHRGIAQAADPAPVLDALRQIALPQGSGFVWIAAEASVARAARDFFLNERSHPRDWVKASGYWKRGAADAHERLDD